MRHKRHDRVSRRMFFRRAVETSMVFSFLPALEAIADDLPPAHSGFTHLAGWLNPFRQSNGLPALAAAVMKNGKVIASGAVGVRKMGTTVPVTMLDKFHLGSGTKTFTATLAAILVEQGKIRWDSTLSQIFPERAEKMHPDFRDVTLEVLLWFRSGLPSPAGWWQKWLAWSKPRGIPAELWPETTVDPRIMEGRLIYLDLALAQTPMFKPGTQCQYGNPGFVVAGAMLERVTGRPWEELIQQKIFNPLGMSSAGFGPCQKPNQVDQPWGHTFKNGRFEPVYGDNPEIIGPAGTIHCALPDYLKFADLHASSGKRGPQLLTAASFAKLQTPPEGQHYAMGWTTGYSPWAQGRGLWFAGSNTMNNFKVRLATDHDVCLAVATNASTFRRDSDGEWVGNEKVGQVLDTIAGDLARFAILGAGPVADSPPKPDTAARLKQLNKLHQQGLIPDEIYQQKRKEILDSL
jgi:CubicO group peptidase (beta-lactamase class C family)